MFYRIFSGYSLGYSLGYSQDILLQYSKFLTPFQFRYIAAEDDDDDDDDIDAAAPGRRRQREQQGPADLTVPIAIIARSDAAPFHQGSDNSRTPGEQCRSSISFS